MTKVNCMVNHLAKQPIQALAAVKCAMHAAPTQPLDAQSDLERDLQCEFSNSRNYIKGISAFLNKRVAHSAGG